MVSLAEQRRGAEHLEAKHGVSERRACQVIEISRSSKRRPSGRIEEATLVHRVHELSQLYPRFGYRKIFAKCMSSDDSRQEVDFTNSRFSAST
jgi:putative transposase